MRGTILAVTAGLAIGLALFLHGFAAHVAPYYPRFFDQASGAYFGLYRTHYAFADSALPLAARIAASSLYLFDLRGWAVPWIATALGFAFGANRVAFASANYVFFAAMVLALAAAMARRCDGWTAAATIGLALTSRSVFLPAGGLHDLRLDFAGLAMFGIFALALWRVAETPDRGRVALAALAYAASLWSRSVTGVYGLIAIGTLGAISLAMTALGRDPQWRRRWRATFALGLAAAAFFALYVALHFREIDGYYFNLLRTDESRIRLAEQGLSSRAELFGFYLRSAWSHFRPLLLWCTATLGLALGAIAIGWLRGARALHPPPAEPGPALAAGAAVLVGVFLPLSVFTPSPVVIGVLTVPLAAACGFALAFAAGRVPCPRIARAILLLPLAAGLWTAGRALLAPPVWTTPEIPSAEAHNTLFERIAADGRGTVAWMTVNEGLSWATFSIYLYETARAADVARYGHLVTAIFALDAETVRARIAEADAVVTWRQFPTYSPFPAVTSMRDTRDAWQPILDREFALRYEFPLDDGTIAYYRRIAPRAPGAG
jgi:hypothetical protein